MAKSTNLIFRSLDFILTRFVFRQAESEERKYAERRHKFKQSDEVLHEHSLYDMNIIDSKSSALLTHVAVMIAVVAFLLPKFSGTFWHFLLAIELLAFSFVAMLLLRCVDVMGPPMRSTSDETEVLVKMYQKEIILRRSIYQGMLRLVFCLTFFLILIVSSELLFPYLLP